MTSERRFGFEARDNGCLPNDFGHHQFPAATQGQCAEPLRQLIIGEVRPNHDSGAVTASPLVAKIAEEMLGTTDPLAAQWLIRVTFSLWYWPVKDKQTEYELVKRFAGPSVTLGLRES